MSPLHNTGLQDLSGGTAQHRTANTATGGHQAPLLLHEAFLLHTPMGQQGLGTLHVLVLGEDGEKQI